MRSRALVERLEQRRLLAAGDLDLSFADEGRLEIDLAGALRWGGIRTADYATDESAFRVKLLETISTETVYRVDELPRYYSGAGARLGAAPEAFAPGGVFDFGPQLEPTNNAQGQRLRLIDFGNAVQRYNADGSLDPSFGDEGTVELGYQAGAVGFRTDGSFVTAAEDLDSFGINVTSTRTLLRTYRSDGVLASGFNGGQPVSIKANGPERFFTDPDGGIYFIATDHPDSGALGARSYTYVWDIAVDGSFTRSASIYSGGFVAGASGSEQIIDAATIDGELTLLRAGNYSSDSGPERWFYTLQRPFGGEEIELLALNGQVPDDFLIPTRDAVMLDDGSVVHAVAYFEEGTSFFNPELAGVRHIVLDPNGNVIVDQRIDNELGVGANTFIDVLEDGVLVFAEYKADQGLVRKFEGPNTSPDEPSTPVEPLTLELADDYRFATIIGTDTSDDVSITLRESDGRLVLRTRDFVRSLPTQRVKTVNIVGLAGNDSITVGPGVTANIWADLGDGDDRLVVGPDVAHSYVHGGAGNDVIIGGNGRDTFLGGPGDDTLEGNAGVDWLYGMGGDDRLIGGLDADRLEGGSGNDYLGGSAGADDLFGNAGRDTLAGGSGGDRLFGGSDADLISGGSGNDIAAADDEDELELIERFF